MTQLFLDHFEIDAVPPESIRVESHDRVRGFYGTRGVVSVIDRLGRVWEGNRGSDGPGREGTKYSWRCLTACLETATVLDRPDFVLCSPKHTAQDTVCTVFPQ